MIKCKLCDKEVKIISTHLTKSHDMTLKQYKRRFPNAPIVDKELSEKRSKKTKAFYNKKGE